MGTAPATKRAPNGQRTITQPLSEERYAEIINDPRRFRAEWLDPFYADCPEPFPPCFEKGHGMKGRHAKRQGIDIRRIALRNGGRYQIRPSFVLPVAVARPEDVEGGLFLRKFGVSYRAIVRFFGRNSIVGTTVKRPDIPTDLPADEHHEKSDGEKIAIATMVAKGVVPGFSKEELKEAYGVFKPEVLEIALRYTPKTVNADGFAATTGAWSTLFVNER